MIDKKVKKIVDFLQGKKEPEGFVGTSFIKLMDEVWEDSFENKPFIPKKGVDYFDGKDGKDGLNGKDADEKEIIKKVIKKIPLPKDGKDGHTPIKGVDYFDGEKGDKGNDGSPDTPKQIKEKLETLKGGDRLSLSAIKDGEFLMKLGSHTGKKLDMSDLRWHGGGVNPSATGLSLPVVTKAVNYTMTSDDFLVLVNAASGNKTISLPSATSLSGKVYEIKKIDPSANLVIIDPSGTETIDNNSTQEIKIKYSAMMIISDGSNWWII